VAGWHWRKAGAGLLLCDWLPRSCQDVAAMSSLSKLLGRENDDVKKNVEKTNS
jgi:hypothetical protein